MTEPAATIEHDPAAGLTGVLAELAERMGSAAGALRLAAEYGGQEVYVPKDPVANHIIARRCGLDVLIALSAIRASERVTIPLGATHRLKKNRIVAMAGSNAQVARAVGCTKRFVEIVRARQRGAAPLPLFGFLDPDDPADTP